MTQGAAHSSANTPPPRPTRLRNLWIALALLLLSGCPALVPIPATTPVHTDATGSDLPPKDTAVADVPEVDCCKAKGAVCGYVGACGWCGGCGTG
ncbi:MAG: hypothetical protein HY902_16340, partial [Deltaproteobacteria bacterium]|nr:hypothetical protein [Deltaproteobacteria bacterium]